MKKSLYYSGVIFVLIQISCGRNNREIDNFNKDYSFKALNSDAFFVNLINVNNKVTGIITNPTNGDEVQISGAIYEDSISLNEYDDKGNLTGIYEGIISDSVIVGSWYKPDKSRKVEFIWKEISSNNKIQVDNNAELSTFSNIIPSKFVGKYGLNCNEIKLEIKDSNPIKIMVNSNQVEIYANLLSLADDNTKLMIFLDKPADLGRGGMALDWQNFSTKKPIGRIELLSINPKTIKIDWFGFYSTAKNKYDWTANDFGNSLTLTNCTDSPEQIKRELQEAEWINPQKHLTLSGVQHTVFNKFSVEITVKNAAMLATYKDVQIKVDYLSKTNSLLLSKTYVQYDFFPPQKTKVFTWNLPDAPRATQYIHISLVNAKPS